MKKVLVVDDETLMRETVVILLKKWGYQVFEAEDGMEGLEASEKHNPDLIITDLIMPKMRGEEVIRFVKTNPKMQDIKIIAISGVHELEPVARAAGCDDFVRKPFDNFLLKKKVAWLLAE